MTRASDELVQRRPARVLLVRGLSAAAVCGLMLAAVPAAATAAATPPSALTTKTVSPGAWSQNVCQALGSYKKDAANLEKRFKASVNRQTSLTKLRAQFAAFLHVLAVRSDQLVSSLKKAGTPSVANGSQIATAIQAGFVQIRDGLEGLVPEAKQVPTDSQPSFKSAITTIEGQLNQLESQNQTTFQSASQFTSPELNAAFNRQSACKALNKS